MSYYISVDVETAGPNPGDYSLLAIGACTLAEPGHTFYIELKPVNERALPEALAVCHLSLEVLAERGTPPPEAMRRFAAWIEEVTPGGEKPLCVAFNAPFDWMFINDYFHRYLGRNPFGHAALDIKAYAMGALGISWEETSIRHLARRYQLPTQLEHHALQDALDQAELFRKLLIGRG
jgi:ribonuclease T